MAHLDQSTKPFEILRIAWRRHHTKKIQKDSSNEKAALTNKTDFGRICYMVTDHVPLVTAAAPSFDFGPGQDSLHLIAKLLLRSMSGFLPVSMAPADRNISSKWNMSRYILICGLMSRWISWTYLGEELSDEIQVAVTMHMVCFDLIFVDQINNSKWFRMIALIVFRSYRCHCSNHMVVRVSVESLW